MPELCPHCGSNEILNDYFEEEWTYWCGQCLREIEPTEMHGEADDFMEDESKDDIPPAERQLELY